MSSHCAVVVWPPRSSSLIRNPDAALASKRLLSLAAEKFVSDIAADAFQYARIRTTGAAKPKGTTGGSSAATAAAAAAAAAASSNTGGKDKSRTVLTMDDLSAALGEYGVNARRAEFYR